MTIFDEKSYVIEEPVLFTDRGIARLLGKTLGSVRTIRSRIPGDVGIRIGGAYLYTEEEVAQHYVSNRDQMSVFNEMSSDQLARRLSENQDQKLVVVRYLKEKREKE